MKLNMKLDMWKEEIPSLDSTFLFVSVLSDDLINCSDCTASVIDELVSSTDRMILTVGWGGGSSERNLSQWQSDLDCRGIECGSSRCDAGNEPYEPRYDTTRVCDVSFVLCLQTCTYTGNVHIYIRITFHMFTKYLIVRGKKNTVR
jgi:hypothetical protein